MSDRLKKLALIPARGGSKRLPGKNVRLLGSKPLVSYTIESAIKSGCFEKIVLSTDSQEIRRIGESYKKVVVDERPEELATDSATIRQVALDLMERYEEAGEVYDVMTVLVPTCPFRNAADIENGLKLLLPDIDSVISVSPYTFPPQKGVIVDSNNLLHPVWPNSPLFSGQTRTQDQFPIYHENGVFFTCRWSSLLKNRSYYIGKVNAYIMMNKMCVDVDDENDFEYAQFLIDSGQIQLGY